MNATSINFPADYTKLKAAHATARLDGQKTFEYQQDTPTGTRPVTCLTAYAGYLLEYYEGTVKLPPNSY